jgi:hypothetical protein
VFVSCFRCFVEERNVLLFSTGGYCAPPDSTCCENAGSNGLCGPGLTCCQDSYCYDKRNSTCCPGFGNTEPVCAGSASTCCPLSSDNSNSSSSTGTDGTCLDSHTQCCSFVGSSQNYHFICPSNSTCCSPVTSWQHYGADCCSGSEQCCPSSSGNVVHDAVMSAVHAKRKKEIDVSPTRAPWEGLNCANPDLEFCCGGFSCPTETLCCTSSTEYPLNTGCCYGKPSKSNSCRSDDNGGLFCP